MSSLWTPSGEHPVPRAPSGGQAGGAGRAGEPGRPGTSGPPGQGVPTGPGSPGGAAPPRAGPQATGGPGNRGWLGREPTPEEVREAEEELAAVREQLARTPAEVVVANHAMGLFDLAALHLSQQPPQLAQAQLAIDALGALVEGLPGRLGEAEKTLSEGLAQLRLAFVQIAKAERARQGANTQQGG